uniref:Uncharacterized protein n=1 Tax=Romanomermis culicivorax TaxID=13658 RepID=A0A915IJ60_ROMCU
MKSCNEHFGQSINLSGFQRIVPIQQWSIVDFSNEFVSAKSEEKQDRVERIQGSVGQDVWLQI